MVTRRNWSLLAPAAIAVLAATVLLILAARAHGKRRARRAWLTERSHP